jgi:hypothetical protein
MCGDHLRLRREGDAGFSHRSRCNRFSNAAQKSKEQLKLTIEIVTNSDEVKTIQVTSEEAYPMIALPVFKPPAYITKQPYESGIELIGYSTTPGKRSVYQQRLDRFAREHDAKEVAMYSLKSPKEWALMFAKVAYALTVRDYGLDRLKVKDVYVLNAILGKCDDIGNWVGGLDQTSPVYSDDYNDQVVGLWEENGEIHAVIKLFAFLNKVPEYQVIVGKLSEPKS